MASDVRSRRLVPQRSLATILIASRSRKGTPSRGSGALIYLICRYAAGCAVILATGCSAIPQETTNQASVALATRKLFEDSSRLETASARLVVSAKQGRVIYFGHQGGRNLLWLDPLAEPQTYASRRGRVYANVGGDKIWPAFQSMWPRLFAPYEATWPPDGVIDGMPWKLREADHDVITIESKMSPELGVIATRQFEWLDDSSLLITNSLYRNKASPFPVMIWSVTQVKPPDALLMDVATDRPELGPRVLLWDEPLPGNQWQDLADGQIVQWAPSMVTDSKSGSMGRGVAAMIGDDVFMQAHRMDPHDAFPDGANIHLYHAPHRYTELELLSGEIALAPGETLTHRVIWRLESRDDRTEHEIATALTRFIYEAQQRFESL